MTVFFVPAVNECELVKSVVVANDEGVSTTALQTFFLHELKTAENLSQFARLTELLR